jgi:hypothetical protein
LFSQEYVHSDEELYRFFKDIPAIVEVTDNGWRLKRSAFTGGSKDSKEVSVDRAWLRDYDPIASQRESSNGVVCFVTRDIRGDKSVPDRNFDVEPDQAITKLATQPTPRSLLIPRLRLMDNSRSFSGCYRSCTSALFYRKVSESQYNRPKQ